MVMEGKLITMLQKQTAAYTMQDLRCQRCKQVKSTSMALLCDCSGSYRLEMGSQDYWRRVRTIRELADFYGLEMVREFADDCLRFV